MQLHQRSLWSSLLVFILCWLFLMCGQPAFAADSDDLIFIPRQAQSVLKLNQPPSSDPLHFLVERFWTSQLAHWGLSWSEINDWVGEGVTLAQFPCPEACSSPRQLWILPLKRLGAATAFWETYWQGHPFEVQVYQNIPLQVGKDLVTARLGDRLLLASDVETMTASLGAAVTADGHLAGLTFYQVARPQLEAEPTALYYVNLQSLSSEGRQLAPTYDRLLLAVKAQANELHLQMLLHRTSDATLASDPFDLEFLRFPEPIPTVVVAGAHLPEGYSQLTAALADYRFGKTPQGDDIVSPLLQDLTADIPVDLTSQIFPLASDRFCLALWYLADKHWQWLWQTTHTPETATLLHQLDDLARANGYEVNRLVLDKEPVTAWVKLMLDPQTRTGLVSDVAAAYGQRGDRLILASSLSVFSQHQSKKLSWLPEHLLRQRQGIHGLVYARWPQLFAPLSQRWPLLQYLNGITAGWLERLQSLTLVNYGVRDRLQHLELILSSKNA
ncbi:MAG TPA: DUF3352 domain-containing protein [Thermosynechococcus sp. M3746_W2019_013]|uniref:DUF3352 domain-containing protein n=1 Tax=Thermosynechococcus sp. M3746_W2019_013 TaxID=2747806 RepID=UPI001A00DC19|nr:DUF3352 domain-containing protein [Thermosynechococcus sp. M3746_W2019_013]HIK23513.1 DUF3352 domain-containing protein [Thermosynechococcus sp. M3746_W2019_013]